MPNDFKAIPITIITGASRGLGRAMARQRLQEGHCVLTLQRSPDHTLGTGHANDEAPNPVLLEQWSVDLSAPQAVANRLQDWITRLPRETIASLSLINNAAHLLAPSPLWHTPVEQISLATRASLEAPLLLCAAFLRASQDLRVPRKILNISSGLGRHAMAGSTVYCAAKAGMDHFSRALALEEATRPHGAKIVALAPGVIDTDMQVKLRGADPRQFPDRERFVGLKSKGMLDSPEAAGAKVLAYLDRADFGSAVLADVRTSSA